MLVRIVSGVIDEAEAVAAVSRPGNGAVLVFRGVVRDRHEGRTVTRIDYQAYEAMAERELHQIAGETAAAFGLPDLAVVHRIGRVEVGEVSLLVAAGAPHRRAAFEGVMFLVDELKRRVPVWKKEYGPDGACWVEGVLPAADRAGRAADAPGRARDGSPPAAPGNRDQDGRGPGDAGPGR